ncbi:MAG: hypothetical protein QOG84_851 [Sphingomonadales bacterium]|jgi:hypothetical protein|nr:hypothetical protein [Sphingomonadales bacterium]
MPKQDKVSGHGVPAVPASREWQTPKVRHLVASAAETHTASHTDFTENLS